jgi:hypothetical protein
MKLLQKTVVVLGILFGGAPLAFAGDSGLVSLLVQQLGVTTPQAEGGAGAIFNAAKQKLSPEEYTQVSDAVPEATTLLDKAPEPKSEGGMTGTLGGVSSALGGSDAGLGGAAQAVGGMSALSDSFSSLGMNSDMVGKFMPIVLDYAKSKGGDMVMNLLKGALM